MTRTVSVFLCLLLTAMAPLAHAVKVDDLIKRSLVSEVKISPDGKYLAFRIFMEGKYSLRFLDRKTMKVVGGFSLNGKSEVGDFYWVSNERVVGQTIMTNAWEERPTNYGELFGVNFDGSLPKLLFGYRAGTTSSGHIKQKRPDRATAEIASVLPDDPRHILIAKTPFSLRGAKSPELVRLDVDDGTEKSMHLYTKYGAGRFYIDREGNARIMKSLDANNVVHVQALPDIKGDWIDMDQHFGQDFRPVALSDDGNSLYALDNANTDTLGLFKLSLDGKQEQKIYVNDTVDITDAVRSTDKKRVYALRIDKGYTSYLILSSKDEEAAIFKALLKVFAGSKIYIESKTRDGHYWVVYTANDTDPGSYYLFDKQAHKLQLLVKAHAGLNPAELAPVKPIEFKSFDGLPIHGYFTQAVNTRKKPAPMVVMVHGGPRVRDYWTFDSEVQILATNGFSVLQINYRGSSGYGKKFLHMGDHEWGKDIQKDIIAGTRWAIAQHMAPADKVCIMGGSFGAYSAVQSAEMAPDLYACAVANAGIYDLKLMYKKGDIPNYYFGKSFLEEAIGTDDEQLAAYSPVNHVDKLKAPVFISHGTKDPRAPFAHAKELRAAMDKAHKPYVWFIKGREGHGFYNLDDEREYLKAVLKFLKKHT